jgi:hypothetical protein
MGGTPMPRRAGGNRGTKRYTGLFCRIYLPPDGPCRYFIEMRTSHILCSRSVWALAGGGGGARRISSLCGRQLARFGEGSDGVGELAHLRGVPQPAPGGNAGRRGFPTRRTRGGPSPALENSPRLATMLMIKMPVTRFSDKTSKCQINENKGVAVSAGSGANKKGAPFFRGLPLCH